MGFYRKEVFADELGSVLIFIRLASKPSTGSSGRSRAEIQQDGAELLLGCGQGLIDIPAPIHDHDLAPYRYSLMLSCAWLRRIDTGQSTVAVVEHELGRIVGFGFQGMRERPKQASGELAIRSEVDSGTEIKLTVKASRARTRV
jgi:hypothetical protein